MLSNALQGNKVGCSSFIRLLRAANKRLTSGEIPMKSGPVAWLVRIPLHTEK